MRNPGLIAWIHLMRVHQKLHHHSMADLARYDITPAQFEVIAHLFAAQGISQQALAEKLLVTKGNVCGLIDRLAVLGLVERRCHPEDRRSNLLFLTDKGQQLAAEVIPAHEAHIADHMSVLTPDDQRTLAALLRELDRSLPQSA
jgi:DNA-binding MarR family transcriptional regulator